MKEIGLNSKEVPDPPFRAGPAAATIGDFLKTNGFFISTYPIFVGGLIQGMRRDCTGAPPLSAPPPGRDIFSGNTVVAVDDKTLAGCELFLYGSPPYWLGEPVNVI